MNNILYLIYEFFKTGLFAVGGGLATIPFLKEIIIKYNFFELDMLTTMIGISESTPGPIGINLATYFGYLTYGIVGGIITTIAIVTPSLIVIIMIAKTLDKFKESLIIKGIFYGIKPAVVAFIISACINIFISSLFNQSLYLQSKNICDLFNFINIFIFIIVLLVYKKFSFHPVFVIALCAFLGILLKI